MTAPLDELPADARRRLMVKAVVRPTALCVGTVTAYYVLPLDRDPDVGAAVRLAIGLAVVAGLVLWQAWSILRAEHPRLRAVEALASTFPLFVVVFAGAHYLTSQAQPGAFTEVLSRTDALYFTMTVLSTVGFGDIVPVSTGARVLTMTQMVCNLLLLGVAARVLVGAVRVSVDRKRTAGAARGDEPSPTGSAGRKG